MNYLAHLYLAGDDPESRVGSLMGDFVKGRVDPARPPAVRRAILQHRHIDSFTDAHPVVQRSKRRIRPPFRRYAGILVDVFYDHYLAANWHHYATEPLGEFAGAVYTLMTTRLNSLPPAMQRSMRYMVRNDLLVSYRQIDGIARALRGIETRLQRPSRLGEAVSELDAAYAALGEDFAEFFPELIAFVQDEDTGRGCR